MAVHTRNPKYVALLAAVATAILVMGTLLKPRRQRAETTLTSQAELSRLNRLAQKTSLDNIIDYFSQIAYNAAPHVVRVDQAQASGLVWDSEGLVIASATGGRFPEAAEVKSAGPDSIPATTSAASPDQPIVVLRAEAETQLRPARRFPVVLPYVSDWVVAVWRTAEGTQSFAPGHFLGVERANCGAYRFDEVSSSIPFTPAMVGGGLFDQDERLLGVIVRCGGRYVAMSVESVSESIAQSISMDGLMASRYGFKTASLTESEQKHFRAQQGVLVREVWRRYPAESSGLKPGDIIQTLDGAAVNSPEDLRILAMPPAREVFELGLERGRRKLAVSLAVRVAEPDARDGDAAQIGLVLKSPASGYRIESILPGSRAERVGIAPGDSLLEVDGVAPGNEAQVVRALTNGKSRFLVLERGDRRWGVLLEE